LKDDRHESAILKGQWREIKGDIKTKWGKLTGDDLTEIEGKEEKLLGLLQKRHGYDKDKAEQSIKNSRNDMRNLVVQSRNKEAIRKRI
jgi:uncharacterized protein YjbJ (UPF0337 family)